MKFRVTGSNRQTGARMSLEFEAGSKAQAERKAEQAGMSVNHAEPIPDESEPDSSEPSTVTRRRVTGMHPIIRLLILAAIVAIAYYFVFLWPLNNGGVD